MQAPRKHHYIPEFYLKRWALSPKGQLVQYSRPYAKSPEVKALRQHPGGTGYQHDGYSFDGFPPKTKAHIETAFFSPLDSKAADALGLLETEGGRAGVWTDDLRQAWASFLISLIQRHPADITAFKAVHEVYMLQNSSHLDPLYQDAKAEHQPPNVVGFFQSTEGKQLLGNMAVNTIPKLIDRRRSLEDLMNMHWRVIDVPADGCLLTSDRPTLRTFLKRRNSFWKLPIGPRKLFVAVSNPDDGFRIKRTIAQGGWQQISREVVRRAVSLSFADSDRYLDFCQKHLAAETRPSIFYSFVANPVAAGPLYSVP